jgi:hypothetical protein
MAIYYGAFLSINQFFDRLLERVNQFLRDDEKDPNKVTEKEKLKLWVNFERDAVAGGIDFHFDENNLKASIIEYLEDEDNEFEDIHNFRAIVINGGKDVFIGKMKEINPLEFRTIDNLIPEEEIEKLREDLEYEDFGDVDVNIFIGARYQNIPPNAKLVRQRLP